MSEQGNSAGQKSSGNRNRNRNRNRNKSYYNKNKKPSSQQESSSPQAVKSSAKNNASSSNKRRRRPNNRNRNRKGPTGPEKVINKYLNVLELHLQARKKYFSFFHRSDPKQLAKIERNYFSSMEKLREFEATLSEKEKEIYKAHFDGLSIDRTYSTNREISYIGEMEVSKDHMEDPHYLVSQQDSDYSEDTEESVGTMEDYLAYKGL